MYVSRLDLKDKSIIECLKELQQQEDGKKKNGQADDDDDDDDQKKKTSSSYLGKRKKKRNLHEDALISYIPTYLPTYLPTYIHTGGFFQGNDRLVSLGLLFLLAVILFQVWSPSSPSSLAPTYKDLDAASAPTYTAVGNRHHHHHHHRMSSIVAQRMMGSGNKNDADDAADDDDAAKPAMMMTPTCHLAGAKGGEPRWRDDDVMLDFLPIILI